MNTKKLKFPTHLTPSKEVGGRYYFTSIGEDFPYPDLIEHQHSSYDRFMQNGILELLQEINPIYDATQKKLKLEILDVKVEPPKHTIVHCKEHGLTYESVIKAHVSLTNIESGEIKEQDVYFGHIPQMTPEGTFIVAGVEKVIVSQLTRSAGVYYTASDDVPGRYNAKLIPGRGAWIEIETDKKDCLWLKVDRKRKIPLGMFLKCFGYETDEQILSLLRDTIKIDTKNSIIETLKKDTSESVYEAWQTVYRRVRPGDVATPEGARNFIRDLFTTFKRYDLGEIARYKMNQKYKRKTTMKPEGRILLMEDFVSMIHGLVECNEGIRKEDDIDNLSNRRVRGVGELLKMRFRLGLTRSERIIKDRMSIVDIENVTPTQLVNSRPITASLHEFFATSQLSQMLDHTNHVSALETKRRLTAMGPGGLTRERATFDVRDLHPSHYGRICPVTTPEGPNIGLVLYMASFARVNNMGFIETPYRKIRNQVQNDGKSGIDRNVSIDIKIGKTTIKEHTKLTDEDVKLLQKEYKESVIPVYAYLSDDVEYYDAEEEYGSIEYPEGMTIASANTEVDDMRQIIAPLGRIEARHRFETINVRPSEITHIDISPKQIVSLATSQMPFLENDENGRALMASNMMRQAIPTVRPQSPIVGTGVEAITSIEVSHRTPEDALVKKADSTSIVLTGASGKTYTYDIKNFYRTPQDTCHHERVLVNTGQKLKKGDPIVDTMSTENGESALGQNLLVAYMSWDGYNYEDAVILSQRVIEKGQFNSIHIKLYELDVRDTKLGQEELTNDIPNVSPVKLKDLDETGIVRIGATVMAGDILAGKVSPKGETELSAEDRLLRAIFGDKSRDVKDSSLRLPRGSGGKVIGVRILDKLKGDELPAGTLKRIQIEVAQLRHMEPGDKMAGRHGNKGVVSIIVPTEDMPFMEDGTPIDIILNPLGVISRMNLGQVLEAHLGMCCRNMNIKVASPVLNGIKIDQIQDLMVYNNLPSDGKFQLYDGKTGEPFNHRTLVGITYMQKLSHMVEDKVHARSVGPYSLVTQQPFGGKARNGGQRFGEMEVWALEAYGASHTLQEMLTIKSDDVQGRVKAYENIIENHPITDINTPESFNVLVKELQSLGLKVNMLQSLEGVSDSDEEFDMSDE